jgi:hydrogenase-4 component B
MSIFTLISTGLALFLALSCLGAFAARALGTLVYVGSAVAAGLLMMSGLMALLEASGPATASLPLGVPWIGAHFRVDALSAFFLLVVNLGAVAASVFGIGYGRHDHAPGRVVPFFPAFLLGMNLVVLADDAFTFLLSWEFMSLASWALVMAHHKEAGNARAGYIYITMASFGTLALLLAFGLLAGSEGHYGFDAMRGARESPRLAVLVLALAVLGAGSKAGLVPLHVWLPLAHPAAPSHVSALMSGVMTKVAVYGFIRIAFDLLGPTHWAWSIVPLVLGAITAVLGLLHAILQRDLKRLLAYSTVENIGVIFIGLGLALAFKASAMPAAAALAISAALLHALNHAAFKSLLFLGAGAVLTATGKRDIEQLGGLIHRMPYTSALFLVGAAAISALPPLNGFVSEWLLCRRSGPCWRCRPPSPAPASSGRSASRSWDAAARRRRQRRRRSITSRSAR